MNFYEGVTFIADFLFIVFFAMLMVSLFVSLVYYIRYDHKKNEEDERKEKERADELDAEIDYVAKMMGYVKPNVPEEKNDENME